MSHDSTIKCFCQVDTALAFFVDGVRTTAEGALVTAELLSGMFQEDRERIVSRGGRKAGSVLRIHEALKAKPILSVRAACEDTGLSFQAAASAMEVLTSHGIAREITGRRRGRLFAYDRDVSILNEGAEAI